MYNIDEQMKINAERDKRTEAYAQECANRTPTPPTHSGERFSWSPIDALGLQVID